MNKNTKTRPKKGKPTEPKATMGLGKVAAQAATSTAVREIVKPVMNKVVSTAMKALIPRNHPEWYTQTAVSNLVGLNFARRKGVLEYANAIYKVDDDKTFAPISSVLAVGVDVLDTVPRSSSGDDGWRQGITELYANIRSGNAGAANTTIQDVEKYVYAAGQLHTLWATANRALLCLNMVDAYDGEVPRSYFRAMGLDFQSFSSNAGNLRTFMQYFTNYLATAVPLKLPYFDRKRWFYGSCFADSDDAKAVKIFPVCAAMPTMITPETNDLAISDQRFADWGNPFENAGWSYLSFISAVRAYLTTFQNSNKFAIIAGDIMKVYGTDAFYPGVDYSNINETVPVVYDEYLLTQLQNATVRGDTITQVRDSEFGGTVADSWLTEWTELAGTDDERTGLTSVYWKEGRFINWHNDHPTPGETLSVTRLTCSRNDSMTASCTVTWCGGEVVRNWWSINKIDMTSGYAEIAPSGLMATRMFVDQYIDTEGVTSSSGLTFANASFWSQVKFAPYFMNIAGATSGTAIATPMFELNNYAVATDSVLQDFNNAANYSMLQTPKKLKVNNTEYMNVTK